MAAPDPPSNSTTSRKKTLVAACLLAGLIAAGFGVWNWRQYNRPGMTHYLKGMDDVAAGQIPQAEQEWRRGIREDPGDPHCYIHLADLLQREHRYAEAAALYATACRLFPRDGELFLHLAQTEQAQHNFLPAKNAAKRAAELRPDDAEAVGLYGILAAQTEQPQEALSALRRAHALRPDDAGLLIYLVRQDIGVQDGISAERDLLPFLQVHPQNAEACYLMASIQAQKPPTPANQQQALLYARRAWTAAPDNAYACILLGQLLLKSGHIAEALPLFQRAQRLTSSSQPAWQGILDCDTRLGKTREAALAAVRLQVVTARHDRIAHLEDALHLNPSNISATLQMARLQEDDGELRLAHAYYQQAAHHSPPDPRAQTALAGFLHRHSQP